ncbi:hypothetical protein [Microscilla marina]|uniref:Uncharacterized protein n=1 Tax=Microscilla marina ATCC 23134 TaxID=313606 RepID=A1ZXJ0_MICM2|nr:hypothetical protein [Microscilla marina]EAY24865.1 hypothetical protein M23134_05840 [Microscilla marina ATCC 23134]
MEKSKRSLTRLSFPTGYKAQEIQDSNVDVYIILDNQDVYYATFFTLKNIQKLMSKAGIGSAEGCYFWVADMVIIESITLNNIVVAIQDLIQSYSIDKALSKVGNESEFVSTPSEWLNLVEVA